MKRKIHTTFVELAAVMLFVAATFILLTSAISIAGVLDRPCAFLLSSRKLFCLVAGLNLALSAFLLAGRNPRLKLILTAWLAAICLAYQIGTACFGKANLFVCLGNLTEWMTIPPRILNGMVFAILGWLFLGSVGLLTWGHVTRGTANTSTLAAREFTPATRLFRGWGLGATVAVMLLLAMQIHTRLALPEDLDALAEQSFYRCGIRGEPVEDPSEIGLFYLKDENDDLNIFRVNRRTGERRHLAQLKDVVGLRFFKWIGWSPDRRLMAYSTRKEKEEQELVLRDGLTGELHGSFEISSCGVVREGIWLSANSLVLINATEGLYLFNLETAANLGQFGRKGLVRLRFPSGHKRSCLTPDSDHSVAFVWKNDIWTLDIPNNRLDQLTHFSEGSADELSFQTSNERYLFTINTGGKNSNRYLYSLDRLAGRDATSQLLETPAYNAKWLQGRNAIACTIRTGETNYFAVVNFSDGFQTSLFPAYKVNSFSVSSDGNRVYAVALDADALWRIWEYDIGEKSLRVIVPKEEKGPILRQILPPVLASLTNASGKKVEYYCVPPVNRQLGKRYPVFMDLYSPNSFDDSVQFIANAGIYYVSPNRFGITDWRTVPEFENVLAVYEELLKNPNIDSQHIYLAGVSKSTALASELVNAAPEKWRGVILQNPVSVPQIPPDPTRYPRIFISIGDMELPEPRASADQLMLDACRCLIPARMDVQHSRHVHPKPQLKKCYVAMAKFILTDN